jgi:hypothetical protein
MYVYHLLNKIMKSILLLVGLALSSIASAQWSNHIVDNGFDDKYKIAWTADDGTCYLKLEKLDDGNVIFYISGGYFCDANATVDLSFLVHGTYKKYTSSGVLSDDKTTIFMIRDILHDDCIDDFKACTSIKIRINDVNCGTEIYEFNMSGSTSALNFVNNQ